MTTWYLYVSADGTRTSLQASPQLDLLYDPFDVMILKEKFEARDHLEAIIRRNAIMGWGQ